MIYNTRRHLWHITKSLNGACPDCMCKTKMSLLHKCKEFPDASYVFGSPIRHTIDHDVFIHDAISELPYQFVKKQMTVGIEALGLSPKLIEFLPQVLRKVTVDEFGTLLDRVRRGVYLPCSHFFTGNIRDMFPMFLPCSLKENQLIATKLRDQRPELDAYVQYKANMHVAVKQLEEFEFQFEILEISDVVTNLPSGALTRIADAERLVEGRKCNLFLISPVLPIKYT